jgi:DNA-binding NtrC family response regulator
VEDNAEVGTFSTQILRDLGYETVWAVNAEEALAHLADPAAEPFDVVFSDVVMPGMSGVDLGREIRRRYPGMPVLLTSGYSHVLAEDGRHGFELLRKPYAAEDLSAGLRRLTRGRSARARR